MTSLEAIRWHGTAMGQQWRKQSQIKWGPHEIAAQKWRTKAGSIHQRPEMPGPYDSSAFFYCDTYTFLKTTDFFQHLLETLSQTLLQKCIYAVFKLWPLRQYMEKEAAGLSSDSHIQFWITSHWMIFLHLTFICFSTHSDSGLGDNHCNLWARCSDVPLPMFLVSFLL